MSSDAAEYLCVRDCALMFVICICVWWHRRLRRVWPRSRPGCSPKRRPPASTPRLSQRRGHRPRARRRGERSEGKERGGEGEEEGGGEKGRAVSIAKIRLCVSLCCLRGFVARAQAPNTQLPASVLCTTLVPSPLRAPPGDVFLHGAHTPSPLPSHDLPPFPLLPPPPPYPSTGACGSTASAPCSRRKNAASLPCAPASLFRWWSSNTALRRPLICTSASSRVRFTSLLTSGM